MAWLTDWRSRVRVLRREVAALACAMRDPRVPWYAKALAAGVVGYALSPIDVIPDFIPVLGLLDDLVLVPAGILLVRQLIPPAVLEECRHRAVTEGFDRRSSWVAALVIVALWAARALGARSVVAGERTPMR